MSLSRRRAVTAHSSAFSRSRNRLLRFEVVVEPALGQSQVVQDVLDGRLLVALFQRRACGRNRGFVVRCLRNVYRAPCGWPAFRSCPRQAYRPSVGLSNDRGSHPCDAIEYPRQGGTKKTGKTPSSSSTSPSKCFSGSPLRRELSLQATGGAVRIRPEKSSSQAFVMTLFCKDWLLRQYNVCSIMSLRQKS